MSEDLDLNPNEQRKKKQLTIIVVGAILLIVAVVGSLFFLGEDPAQKQSPQAKAEDVKLTPPGGIDDNAAWRTGAAQDLAATNERLANLETVQSNKDSEINTLKSQLDEMNQRVQEAERIANNASRTPRLPAQPTNTNPPSNTSSAFGANKNTS